MRGATRRVGTNVARSIKAMFPALITIAMRALSISGDRRVLRPQSPRLNALVRKILLRGASTLADLTIGTAIVLIHVVLADTARSASNATPNRGGWT